MSKAQKCIYFLGWLFIASLLGIAITNIDNTHILRAIAVMGIGTWLGLLMIKVEEKKHE